VTVRDALIEADHTFFWKHGYVIVRNVFSPQEMAIAKEAIANHEGMNSHVGTIKSKIDEGKHSSFSTIFVWNDTAGNDLFAKLTRNHQIFDRIGRFFEDQPYVYHNKVALKYPGINGFSYHQDYFYWYGMGCLYPDMATVMIAVDPATRENGCLRVLDGSHKLGRVEHVFDPVLEDSAVEKERLEVIRLHCREVHLELGAGDIAIFHCNTLHGSDDNASDQSRIGLLGCYNTKHNNPYKATVSGHPFYQEQSAVYEKVTRADLNHLPNFWMRFDEPV